MNVKARQALAIRRLNAQYAKVPNPESVQIFTDDYRHLERQIDLSVASGDDLAAIRAIEAYEARTLKTLTEAIR